MADQPVVTALLICRGISMHGTTFSALDIWQGIAEIFLPGSTFFWVYVAVAGATPGKAPTLTMKLIDPTDGMATLIETGLTCFPATNNGEANGAAPLSTAFIKKSGAYTISICAGDVQLAEHTLHVKAVMPPEEKEPWQE